MTRASHDPPAVRALSGRSRAVVVGAWHALPSAAGGGQALLLASEPSLAARSCSTAQLPYCTYTLGTVGSHIVGLPYCTYTLGTVGPHIVGLPYCTYTCTVGSHIVGLPYCTYTIGAVGSHIVGVPYTVLVVQLQTTRPVLGIYAVF